MCIFCEGMPYSRLVSAENQFGTGSKSIQKTNELCSPSYAMNCTLDFMPVDTAGLHAVTAAASVLFSNSNTMSMCVSED